MFRSLLGKTASLPEEVFVNIDDQDIRVVLKRHAKAKRLILRQDTKNGGFRLTVPKHANFKVAEHFIYTHKDWIADQLDGDTAPQKFQDGSIVSILGHNYTIVHDTERLRGIISLNEADAIMRVPGPADHLHRRVCDFLKKEVRSKTAPLARIKADRIGKKIKRIRIADQKTRWGSCSTSGTLSFSCRLIFTPDFVLDYVVAHEVAHLEHMNHSAEFWDLCESLCHFSDNGQDMKAAKKWLKTNSSDTTQYLMR